MNNEKFNSIIARFKYNIRNEYLYSALQDAELLKQHYRNAAAEIDAADEVFLLRMFQGSPPGHRIACEFFRDFLNLKLANGCAQCNCVKKSSISS